MRLADFILSNTEAILAEWEAFACSIWPGDAVEPSVLRDHAEEILRSTARDMQTLQTVPERDSKSKGRGDHGGQGARIVSIASLHASDRHTSGFSVMALISEYRALRANVFRLWRLSKPVPDDRDLEDLTRFNEAMDQSITEAVRTFTDRVAHERQLFLAILGHDLRNPLNAVALAGNLLASAGLEGDLAALAAQIPASTRAISRLLEDMLDFTGTELTGTLSIEPAPMDLNPLCKEVIRETCAANPHCDIDFHPTGDLTGNWDARRLRQVLTNLLANACQHGLRDRSIHLTAAADGPAVIVTVHNDGPPISPEILPTIFQVMVRGPQAKHRPGSFGLGLYITRAIILGHGGTIDVTSTTHQGTTFTIHLPRAQLKA